MLLLHETHKVVGLSEYEFEEAFRASWLPALAAGNEARLLWYFHLAHGSNISYASRGDRVRVVCHANRFISRAATR